MHALLFEVTPTESGRAKYFEIATSLRPDLDKNPGLIFIDRYQSLARDDVILSHSLWRDEASIAKWRTHHRHHAAQVNGREEIFKDYRLRIAQVFAEYRSMTEGVIHEARSPYNDPTLTGERYFTIVTSRESLYETDNGESFASVNRCKEYVTIVSGCSKVEAMTLLSDVHHHKHVSAARACLVSRDYGMYERVEAPQYFPPIVRSE